MKFFEMLSSTLQSLLGEKDNLTLMLIKSYMNETGKKISRQQLDVDLDIANKLMEKGIKDKATIVSCVRLVNYNLNKRIEKGYAIRHVVKIYMLSQRYSKEEFANKSEQIAKKMQNKAFKHAIKDAEDDVKVSKEDSTSCLDIADNKQFTEVYREYMKKCKFRIETRISHRVQEICKELSILYRVDHERCYR